MILKRHPMELYASSKKLDLRKSVFPSTFVMTQQALSHVEKGDIVQVRLSPGEHMQTVPSALLHEGHQVIDIVKDGNSYVLYILKQ